MSFSLYSQCGRTSSASWSAHGKDVWDWTKHDMGDDESAQEAGNSARIWTSGVQQQAQHHARPTYHHAATVNWDGEDFMKSMSSTRRTANGASRQSLYGEVRCWRSAAAVAAEEAGDDTDRDKQKHNRNHNHDSDHNQPHQSHNGHGHAEHGHNHHNSSSLENQPHSSHSSNHQQHQQHRPHQEHQQQHHHQHQQQHHHQHQHQHQHQSHEQPLDHQHPQHLHVGHSSSSTSQPSKSADDSTSHALRPAQRTGHGHGASHATPGQRMWVNRSILEPDLDSGANDQDKEASLQHRFVPTAEQLRQCYEALEASVHEDSGARLAASFHRALRFAAAVGDFRRATELLQRMKDEHGLPVDQAASLAALEALEGTSSSSSSSSSSSPSAGGVRKGGERSLQRAWLILDELRKKGTDPLAAVQEDPAARDPDVPALRCSVERGKQSLKHHAEAWLLEPASPLPPKAYHEAICCASALKQIGDLEPSIESSVRSQILVPVVQALKESLSGPLNKDSALLHVPTLGPFTREALEMLQFDSASHNGDGDGDGDDRKTWQSLAQAELRRQELLRRFTNWEESVGTGLSAWIAFDLSGGSGTEAWELQSDGETFGFLSTFCEDAATRALLPPLFEDIEGNRHGHAGEAERRALLSLAVRILKLFGPSAKQGGARVEGIVMLYSLRAPSVAALHSCCQFLRLFPWVRFHIDYGAAPTSERLTNSVVAAVAPGALPLEKSLIRLDSSGGAPAAWGRWSGWRSEGLTGPTGWSRIE